MSDSLSPHGLQPSRLPCLWGFSKLEYWSGLPCPPPEDLSNPGIEPRSPTLQVDSFPAEPPGKPKYTGVGSLSLLQWIFLTQELNQGLLHHRWILYQLSYEKHTYKNLSQRLQKCPKDMQRQFSAHCVIAKDWKQPKSLDI